MADKRVTSNGNIQVWFVPAASLTNPAAPDPTEVNTYGTNLSRAVVWDGSTWPTSTGSNDTDDRSILDAGNATSRGFPQFEATLNFFRPPSVQDTLSDFGKAFHLFRTTRVPGYLITRVLQGPTGLESPLTGGQLVSVFKMLTTTFVDDTEGEDTYKYAVNFAPQGDLFVYTQAKGSGAVTLSPLTLALDVDEVSPVRATLNGHRYTQAVTWTSSDPAVATVSRNGVVTAVSAGTANITASHPASTGTVTPCVVTVT